MRRLSISDRPLQFSLWWIFGLLCFLPLASTLLLIPRPILFSVGLLLAISLLVFIFRRDFFRIAPLTCFMIALFYLLLQYSKTAYHYDIGLGLASIFRYLLFALVIWAIYQKLVSERAVSQVQNVAILFCFFAILGGEALDNYIFKNGVDRFMGVGHSPAPLAMLLALVALVIFHRINELVTGYRKSHALLLFYCVSLAIFLFYLYKTGSRQPLLGFLLVISVLALSKVKPVYSLVAVVAFSIAIIKSGVDVSLFGRIGLMLLRVWESDSIYSIAAADTSVGARIHYITVGLSELWHNGFLFGLGLNSFPGVYGEITGKEGVAPHNDLLLFFLDFGVIPTATFFFFVICLSVIFRKKITSKQLSFFMLWATGFSLNNFFFYWMLVILLLISIVPSRGAACAISNR